MASGGGCRTSLFVAAGVAAVEALKDQAGLCRWNYALRSLHQRAENNLAGSSRRGKMAPSSAAAAAGEEEDRRRWMDRVERSMDRVMYWDAWGPK